MKAKSTILIFVLLALVSLGQSIDRDNDSRAILLTAAREIIKSSGTCALITTDENGTTRARTMDPFEPEEDFTIWLATNPKSRKVEQLKGNPNVTLYYNDKNNNGYVTVQGKAFLVNDQHEKDKRWKDSWKSFYPNRTDEYLLIKIIPIRLEVINYARGINGDPVNWQPAEVLFRKD